MSRQGEGGDALRVLRYIIGRNEAAADAGADQGGDGGGAGGLKKHRGRKAVLPENGVCQAAAGGLLVHDHEGLIPQQGQIHDSQRLAGRGCHFAQRMARRDGQHEFLPADGLVHVPAAV